MSNLGEAGRGSLRESGYNIFTPNMRVLLLSDVHANLTALDAVLRDAGTFDQVWCLGDIVGYGPQPNECISRLREFELISLTWL